MTVHVPFDLAYEMDVRADADAVYAVLADVPLSASHFPGLERLVDLGGNRYRWELAKLGTEHVHLQTVYASRYHCDRQRRSVRWEPVAGEGSARVGGRWVIEPRPQGTHLRLELAGELDVPAPAITRALVAPLVVAENERLIERYLANLAERFGGEV